MRLKHIATFSLLILALAGGWLAVTPGRTVRALQDAARLGDPEALDRDIDFPAVRENLKADLKAALLERSKNQSDDLLAGLGVMLGGAIFDRAVDAFVSPSGIAAVSRGYQPDRRSESARSGSDSRDYDIDRRGFNTFVVHFEDGDGNAPVLIFSRRGFRWELTRIGLPETAREPRSRSRE